MSSRLPIGRTIGAIFFLGVACYLFLGCLLHCAKCRRRQRFRCPVALGVDFSAPGAYAASFDWRKVYVRDAYLGLDIPETALSGAAPEALLASLQGTYAVLNAEGKKVLSGSLAQDVDTDRLPRFEIIRLVHWGVFPLGGKCKINVTVAQGAPELKGIPQRLVIVIDDGLDFMFPPVRWIMYIGCVCLLLAVIILTAPIAVSVCAKKRRDKSQLSFESDHVERGRSTSRWVSNKAEG